MNANILIVDDSLTVRMDLKEAFETEGYATILSPTLRDASTVVEKDDIDLVVLDVLLPDGDGINFLGKLKSESKTAALPVMLLSTEAEVRDRIRGMRTGADEYIGKPYERSYVTQRAAELLKKHGKRPAPDRPLTVLIIDDSKTFRERLSEIFVKEGYSVLCAETGEEGIRSALRVKPDAVVVDGQLPGIDGITVVRRMKTDSGLRRIPCLLLTGWEIANDQLLALEAGADAFVRKDEGSDIIVARLAAMLRKANGPSALDFEGSLFSAKRILAVDDSQTYLHELADALRQDGYDVLLAHSGEEALDLMAVQPADCILLDVVMPGLSGQETCKRIKACPSWRDIPLVMLTAKDDRASMIEGFQAGADDYIPKSSEFEILKARLRAQLRRKHFEDENYRIREVLLTNELEAAQARASQTLAEERGKLLAELEASNRELEAFSYSVSHDLRAPLRSIDAFSHMLLEDYAGNLDDEGQDYLKRICASTERMAQLIDDLLALSRTTRSEWKREQFDLSAVVRSVANDLSRTCPDRNIQLQIADNVIVDGDARLLRVVFENLLKNAFKFTSKHASALIEFGTFGKDGQTVYFVRDNGAGFDMEFAGKLFGPFQRLHAEHEFEGTGIGLAIVQRIVHRHGGQIWAEAEVEKGAAFFFTLHGKR